MSTTQQHDLRDQKALVTGARIGTVEGWNERIEAIQAGGMSAVRQTVLGRFVSPRFRDANPQGADAISDTFTATDPVGYIGGCMAVRDADVRSLVSTISVPSLIVAGAHDESTPPSLSDELHNAIPGSKWSCSAKRRTYRI
jgi:3-oxoadipate enol-lactonase